MSNIEKLGRSAAAQGRAITRVTAGCVTVLFIALSSLPAQSQVVLNQMPLSFTLEAYGNTTAGATREAASIRGQAPDAVSFDGAARVLARLATPNGPNIGVRIVAEAVNPSANQTGTTALSAKHANTPWRPNTRSLMHGMTWRAHGRLPTNTDRDPAGQ